MIEKNITPNENLVQVFCGVRGYEEDGVAYLHIEDAARGLGFEREKNGAMYVMWGRVEQYLADLSFHTCVESANPHDYYIPENIFYRLCMKAKNEVAEKFQAKVADEIIPSIRKTGSYSITKPDSYMIEDRIERAKRWIEETEEWQKALSAEETAHAETKALLAEEKEKVEALNDAVDDLVRTKAWIGDKKVASAMGTAGAKSKECERLREKLDKVESEMDSHIRTACDTIRKEYEEVWVTARDWCFKRKLPVYANEPKWTVSNSLAGICMAYPDREQWHMNAYGTRLFPKWACDILDKVYDEDDTFLSEYRAD